MKEKITELLKQLEKNNNIKILFAIENGSRAWNMASNDSDYDVRFVFYRPIENYISLRKSPDVINIAYDNDLKKCDAQGSLIDISGFDVFKYTKLLYNSNPTTIEWLISPILYYGDNNINLREYIMDSFNPKALFFHYFSLFKNNYKEFLQSGQKLTLKKYLYSMRGLLNAKFVHINNTTPPLDFLKTVELLREHLPAEVYQKINEIIEIKSLGQEKDYFGNIEVLDKYFIENLEYDFSTVQNREMNIEIFSQFLQKTLLS